jgi:hypothetical protein
MCYTTKPSPLGSSLGILKKNYWDQKWKKIKMECLFGNLNFLIKTFQYMFKYNDLKLVHVNGNKFEVILNLLHFGRKKLW